MTRPRTPKFRGSKARGTEAALADVPTGTKAALTNVPTGTKAVKR